MVRGAFTMIELVLAIVIIGFAMMSLPTMSRSNDQAFENNVVQEAIFGSSAKLYQLLSYAWDQNSRPTDGRLARVVDLNGTTAYRRVGTTNYRVGHVAGEYHRQFHEINATARSVTTSGTQPASISGQAGQHKLAVGFSEATAVKAYKEDYNTTVTVNYVNDTSAFSISGGSTPTSMKMAEINVFKVDGTLITTLRAYAANIGESEYFSRPYP